MPTPPGKLALFDPADNSWVSIVSLPAGYGQPLSVQVNKTGKIWFTMPVTNSIGVYDPASGTVTQWAVPTAGAGPWDLAIDSTGKIWFTEHYTDKIGSFDPVSQTFNEIATPATNSNPYGITVDASGNVWFTENTDAVGEIGEYTSGGTLNEYRIRNTQTSGTGLTPHLITIAPNGNIWWSEGWVSAIATLNLAAAQPGTNDGVTEYPYVPSCSTCGSHTSGISADSQGNIWLDDSLQNTFGSFPMGGGAFSFYNAPTSAGHPHDGLNVDTLNRVWFDEEFANKLAEGCAVRFAVAVADVLVAVAVADLGDDAGGRYVRSCQSGTVGGGLGWARLGWRRQQQERVLGQRRCRAGLEYRRHQLQRGAGPAATDAEVYATGSISSFSNSNFGDVLRWTNGNNWYKASLTGTKLLLQKRVAGTTTTLGTVSFSAAAGISYTIHFRVVGSTLTASAWPASGPEPSGWMITATDSSLASGYCGMRFLTQSGTATVTTFQAGIPGGSSSSPSPSPSPSPTSSSPSPSPTSGTTLAADTFDGSNQALWGAASDGHAWGGDANSKSVFSVSGDAGLVSNTGGTSYSAALVPRPQDAEVYATGSISSFSNSNFGDVLRWTNGNNWYKASLTGTKLLLQKRVAGTTTTLGTVSFAAAAGISYTIHFRVVGSTLTASAWPASGPEPSGWMITATDSSLTSGYCGMRFLTQSGTATVTTFQANAA